jgi:YNFM family putative membrane transporter
MRKRTPPHSVPLPPGEGGSLGTIKALNFATIAVYADLYITQPILPLLSKEFGVAPATAGLTISIVVLMIAFVSSTYGSLSDAVGRKPVMVTSCLSSPSRRSSARSLPRFTCSCCFAPSRDFSCRE